MPIGPPRLMSTYGSEPTTVTLAPREEVPAVAVIVTAPAATPVTSPSPFTEATLLFELVQDTSPGTSLPTSSTNIALI